MRKFYLSIFLFIFLSMTLYSQTSKIFCVNLYKSPIDLRFGEERTFIFRATKISSYSTSTYVETKNFGSYKMYIKESESNNWIAIHDSKGNQLEYKVEKDLVYASCL